MKTLLNEKLKSRPSELIVNANFLPNFVLYLLMLEIEVIIL